MRSHEERKTSGEQHLGLKQSFCSVLTQYLLSQPEVGAVWGTWQELCHAAAFPRFLGHYTAPRSSKVIINYAGI